MNKYALGTLVIGLALGFFAGTLIGDAQSAPSDINIHNIQKSFDPMACEVTITWNTDECTTTNLVRWGATGCQSPSYPNTVNSSGGAGRSHSATIDVTGVGLKINFQIESGNACDTQTTGCEVATAGHCIQ